MTATARAFAALPRVACAQKLRASPTTAPKAPRRTTVVTTVAVAPAPAAASPIAAPVGSAEAAETLGEALQAWLAVVQCAEVTRLCHADNGRYLVRYFGDRPIEDFAGKPGGELVATYLRDEMGGGKRGLRERFSGPGNLAHHITYNSARARVNTLRHALEHAVNRGVLASMPEPWPIPPRGSHGQVARARFLLKPELEAAIAREPKKHRISVTTSKCEAPIGPLAPGGTTLGEALAWFMKYGDRRATVATRNLHAEQAALLKLYFGADRPVAEFQGTSGYRLLLGYVEKEGPVEEGGRGCKFTTIRKRLNMLRVVLRECWKRGELEGLPPFPDLPQDATPRERYLTLAEYRQIRDTVAPPWDLWITIGVWTGMHRSDLDRYTWAMVDLGNGPGNGPGPGPAFWLRLNTKNKKKPAWLPMPDELREALTAAYRQNPPADPNLVIVGKANNIGTHMRRACRKLGIPLAAPIDLRRTCATWWIEKGGPKEALRRWLGHSGSSQMVERHYCQITPDMVDGGVEALNRAARDPGSAGAGPQYIGPRLLTAVASVERQG